MHACGGRLYSCVCVCTHVWIRMHASMHACMFTYFRQCVCIYVCVCVHLCMFACVWMYVCAHLHTNCGKVCCWRSCLTMCVVHVSVSQSMSVEHCWTRALCQSTVSQHRHVCVKIARKPPSVHFPWSASLSVCLCVFACIYIYIHVHHIYIYAYTYT